MGNPTATPVWSDMAPPQRYGHSIIYDPLRDRMLIYGGIVEFSDPYTGSELTNDTWSLALGTEIPQWARRNAAGEIPPLTANQTAIYDSARDRMIVIAAAGLLGVWALSLVDSVWKEISPPQTLTLPWFGWSAVLDTRRDRLIVYGGYVPGPHRPDVKGDVWELPLSGNTTWTHLVPRGTPPTPRFDHVAVYDPTGDRMIVFGGSGSYGTLNNETWSLDFAADSAWVQLDPSGVLPSARAGGLAVYDAATQQMLTYGGSPGPGNDVWALSLASDPSWEQIVPAGGAPAPRNYPSLALDTTRQRLLLNGGGYRGEAGETWALSLGPPAIWNKIITPAPGRVAHSLVYDSARRRMLAFGGFQYPGVTPLNDCWSFDLASGAGWARLDPGGAPPPPRSGHVAVLDVSQDRMVIFGGFGVDYLNDLWALNLGPAPFWTPLSANGPTPSARAFSAGAFDPTREQIVLFGGDVGGNVRTSDTWVLSLTGPPTWTDLRPAGETPPAREAASGVYDSRRDRVLMFGGLGSGGFLDDTWALRLGSSPTWSRLPAIGSPEARAFHSAVYDAVNDRMLVFAGLDTVIDFADNQVWALALADTPRWEQLNPSGLIPAVRMMQAAAFDGANLVVFGGFTPGQGIETVNMNDTWMLALPDVTTAVLVSVVGVDAQPDMVRVSWVAGALAWLTVPVYRTAGGDVWSRIGTAAADGEGRMVLEDRSVVPGQRYGYRLGIGNGAQMEYAGEIWVDVPASVGLALWLPRPNPSAPDIAVEFSLPDRLPARIDLFDVSGRRISSEAVGQMGAGTHYVHLSSGRELRPGIYLVQLIHENRRIAVKACVAR